MAKAIVFCADGTWNGPEDSTGQSVLDATDVAGEIDATTVTNVVKLYANLSGQATPETLRLQNEQEKVLLDAAGAPLQVAKYLHGVGDSSNVVERAIGGAFGAGVIQRIVRGYTFVSRWYQPGDAIVLCGFSRGAYTARALGGMIARVGLLDPRAYDPSDKFTAYRLAAAAWARSKSISLAGSGLLKSLGGDILEAFEYLLALPLGADALLPNVPIKAVAVWDTVGALGIPVYADNHRHDLFRFVDLNLADSIEHGLHAMAIDELRVDFGVTRWNPRPDISEVWFVGAHADVGGGYNATESRLSDTALSWMISRLRDLGVRFSSPMVAAPRPGVDQDIHRPWDKPPFDALGRAPRAVQPTDVVHQSVAQLYQANAAYRPQALAALATSPTTWTIDATLLAAP